MSLVRFYCESLDGTKAELSATESHHLYSVRRISKGENVELFDGAGRLASAIVERRDSKKAVLKIKDVREFPETDCKIVIAPSIAKGERFDLVISKCTELGVERICPVLFERTIKQAKNPKTLERWRNLSIAACKQSGRVFLPVVDEPMDLGTALKVLKEACPDAQILVGSLEKESVSLTGFKLNPKGAIAFVGPEGGLTEDEQKILEKHGAKSVRLSDTVLRVETAAIAFAAILVAQRDAQKSIVSEH